MTAPKRIQMTRHRPWRAEHPDAVIVDRRTYWGNPFTIDGCIESGFATTTEQARVLCVAAFRSVLVHGRSSQWWAQTSAEQFDWMASHLDDLRGRDLACWCPLSLPAAGELYVPCHADVLIELANKEPHHG